MIIQKTMTSSRSIQTLMHCTERHKKIVISGESFIVSKLFGHGEVVIIYRPIDEIKGRFDTTELIYTIRGLRVKGNGLDFGDQAIDKIKKLLNESGGKNE